MSGAWLRELWDSRSPLTPASITPSSRSAHAPRLRSNKLNTILAYDLLPFYFTILILHDTHTNLQITLPTIIQRCDHWSMIERRGSAHHFSTIACFNWSSIDQRYQKTSCCGRLAPSGPRNCVSIVLNPGCWGQMSGSMKATFSRRNVRWCTLVLQSPLVAPHSVLRFY